MDLYDAWQKRRFRKFRGDDPYRASNETGDEFRINHDDLATEDNLAKAHELHAVGSRKYLESGRRPPDTVFQIDTQKSTAEPPRGHKRQSALSGNGINAIVEANGTADRSPKTVARLRPPEKVEKQQSDLVIPSSNDLIKPAHEVELQRQDEKQRWKVHQNPALDIEMENLGGTRHILRDFQDQLQILRAQIGLISMQNTELKQQLGAAEADLRDAATSKASVLQELADHKEMLHNVQGDLKLTKNRESRLQRLQESLKQLMEEKEAKLNNDSINSRAVLERTCALQSRIEDLEAQLLAQQGKEGTKARRVPIGNQENRPLANGSAHEGEATDEGKDVARLEELHQLRLENKALLKKLAQHDEAARISDQDDREIRRLGTELASSREASAALQRQAEEQRTALEAAERALAALASKSTADAERADSDLAALQCEYQQLQKVLEDAKAAHKQAVASKAEEVVAVAGKHEQVCLLLNVLEDKHQDLLSKHQLADEESQRRHAEADSELQGMTAQVEVFQQQHSQQQLQISALTADKEGLEAALQQLQEANRRAQEESDSLQSEHRASKEQLEGLQAQSEDLKQQHRDLIQQLREAQSRLRESESQRLELGTHISSLQAENLLKQQEVEGALTATRDALESLQGQHSRALAQHRELQDESRQRLEESKAEAENLERKITELQKQRETSDQHSSDVQAQLEDLRVRHGQLQLHSNTAAADHSQTSGNLQRCVEDLKVQLAEGTFEAERAGSEAAAARTAEKGAKEEAATAVEDAAKANMRAELAEKTAEQARAEASVACTQAQTAREEAAIARDEAAKTCADADGRAEQAEREAAAARQEAEAAREEAEKAKGDAAAAEQKLATAVRTLDEEQAVTRGVLQEAQGRGVLVDQLQRDLRAAMAEVEAYEQRHAEQARALEDLEKQSNGLRCELNANTQKAAEALQNAEAEGSRLKKALDCARDETASKTREADGHVRQIEAATSETLAAKQEAAGLRMDLANAKDKHASEVAMLSSKLEAATAHHHTLEAELASVKESHSKQVLDLRTEAEILKRSRDDTFAQLTALQASGGLAKQTTAAAEPGSPLQSRDAISHIEAAGTERAPPDGSLASGRIQEAEAESARLLQEKEHAERRMRELEVSTSELKEELSYSRAALSDQAAKLQDAIAESAVLRGREAELELKLQHPEAALAAAQAEIATLGNQQMSAASQHLGQAKALEEELREVKVEFERVKRAKEAALQEAEQVVGLQEDLKRAAQELEVASSQSQAKIEQLQEAARNTENSLSARLAEEHAAFEDQKARLSADLLASRRREEDLQGKKDAALAKVAEASKQADGHRDRAEQLSAELEALVAQCSQLEQALETERAEAAKAERAAAAGREELNTAISRLDADLATALAGKVALQRAQGDALREAAEQKEAAQQLRSTLDATHKTHHRTVSDLHDVMKEMREAPERDQAALSFELWRLIEENDMLRARVQEYEADVQQLVNTSQTLGHSNPKQKIQYHLRWKQELEGLRNECTLLLRERFQLEQCIRYLAVRCGLSSAVERDVTASKERTPLEKLQPASLVPHYKFAPMAAHVTDAAGDHVTLEDLTEDVTESPAGSERGSTSTALSNKPEQAVEQQIMARVAFVCNPPASKFPEDPLRPSLTPGALLALPSGQRSRDPVKDWRPRSASQAASGSATHSEKGVDGAKVRRTGSPPELESSAGSFSNNGSLRDDVMLTQLKSGLGPELGRRSSEIGRRSSFGSSTGRTIPKANEKSSKAIASSERLSSKISRAFLGKNKI